MISDLTHLTLAEARDGLKNKRFSAREIAQAHIGAVAQAKALNAYVLETPERALEQAEASDARLAKGEGGAHDRVQPHPGRLHAGVRIDRHGPTLARWRRHARQAQQRRIRHGIVERDLL